MHTRTVARLNEEFGNGDGEHRWKVERVRPAPPIRILLGDTKANMVKVWVFDPHSAPKSIALVQIERDEQIDGLIALIKARRELQR